MESEDLFDKQNQGDLLDYKTTQPRRVLTESGLVTCVQAVKWLRPLTPPQCLCDVARGHNRIHGMWYLSVIEATFLTNQIPGLNRAAV